MKKYIVGISILVLALICFNHKVIAQSFQHIYAQDVMFEKQGASGLLIMGASLKSGLQTITIPDGTGTIYTTYSSSNFLLTTLKAIDAAHGSHSGINWTSFGV